MKLLVRYTVTVKQHNTPTFYVWFDIILNFQRVKKKLPSYSNYTIIVIYTQNIVSG